MEPYRDDEITAALSALRPAPQPAFAAKLDARVAAGFPRESRLGEFSPLEAFDRLRSLKPRQVLLPAGAFALTAIVIATIVVSEGNSGHSDDGMLSYGAENNADVGTKAGDGYQSTPAPQGNAAGGISGETVYEAEDTIVPDRGVSASAATGTGSAGSAQRGAAFDAQNRAVERSAEITLGADPAGVGEAAAKVFDVVHANRGIVLSSSTSDGVAGEAGAEFELLIPSAKVGDAMAAFSGIAEVRSRHEATDDITAPTVSATEHLQDSQARIDSLLAQLAEAETEGEREAVEGELGTERRRAAGLRASLQNRRPDRADRPAGLARAPCLAAPRPPPRPRLSDRQIPR
jgi:hypothetical protein